MSDDAVSRETWVFGGTTAKHGRGRFAIVTENYDRVVALASSRADADRIIADHNDRAALEAELARLDACACADLRELDELRKALAAERERADAAERFLHRQYASRPGAQTGETR